MSTVTIPLCRSWLCLDCHEIGGDAVRCPACASGSLMQLQQVLDREERPKRIEDDDL